MLDLDVHGLLSPEVLERFASTTLMAANLAGPLSIATTLSEVARSRDMRRLSAVSNTRRTPTGAALVIKYLLEQRWSKTLRNLEVLHPSDDDEEPISVGSLYMKICQQDAAMYSSRSPLRISNNDVNDDAFDSVRLSNVPHGMNNLQDHEGCCIMSALNPPPAHRDLLMEMCGLNERELRRAILSQTAYQSCGCDTAIDIAQYCPGCRIEKLLTD